MKDVEKMFDEILLKLNILCGKVDTLEFKVNAIIENKTPKETNLSTLAPKNDDIKYKIDKMRRDLIEKAKQNSLKDLAEETKNATKKVSKFSL